MACVAALHGLAVRGCKFEQLRHGAVRRIEGQRRLLRLQDIVNSRALLARALSKTHQVGGGNLPGWCGEHAGDGNVVVRRGDPAEKGEYVLDQGMLEDGEPGNHKWNLATSKLADHVVTMVMSAVEHREIAPAAA